MDNKKESYSDIFNDVMKFMKEIEAKEESNDVKKAITHFAVEEINFTNLEKSISGEWIEKAGYGVGTVRIWRGKKYKKISASPTRWVRVYDKNDRGAKNAMTRLIHKAKQYKDDPEGMMKLLLENKQRFYNEDQKRYIDLVDRLNAFVDGADYNKKADKKAKAKEFMNGGRGAKLQPSKKETKKNTWDNLSKEEKDKKISDYAAALLDYSAKDYETLKTQIKEGKTGLLGGGDDIPQDERIKVLDKLLESEKKATETATKEEKLSPENAKAFNAYADKYADSNRPTMRYPSEVDIKGKKMLAYTNGKFAVVSYDIPKDIDTFQSKNIQGTYPNIEKVIPEEYFNNSANKVDINLDEVMAKLPKIDFSKKAFNDDSRLQMMKIGNHWYDAKMVKASYDMLKGSNPVVMEKDLTYSGQLCIKTDKGLSVIMARNDDGEEQYKKLSIYDSNKGNMNAQEMSDYMTKKKTNLSNEHFDLVTSYGYKPDSKGVMYGENKKVGFKSNGKMNEIYYEGLPTGLKFSTYQFYDKKDLDHSINFYENRIKENIKDYEDEASKAKSNVNDFTFDETFPHLKDDDLIDIVKWWSKPENIRKIIVGGSSSRKGVPGVPNRVISSHMMGSLEGKVMKMLPSMQEELKRRGVTIKKSIDGELDFGTSLERYVNKSLFILNKY